MTSTIPRHYNVPQRHMRIAITRDMLDWLCREQAMQYHDEVSRLKCVRCGSKRVASILYGMPAFTEEMANKLKNQKLYLGGCCVSGVEPKYHCFDCKKNYGTPPVLSGKQGQEDYRKIVTSVSFGIGGFDSGHHSIQITKEKYRVLLRVHSEFNYLSFLDGHWDLYVRVKNGEYKPVVEKSATYLLTQKEWKKLLNKLYCKLYIHEWERRYEPEVRIFDGESWRIKILLTRGRHRIYRGSNAYPPYWDELKEVLKPYFEVDRYNAGKSQE